MKRFVFESNLRHYVGRLEQANNEHERESLLELLILEIDRYASESDMYSILQRHLCEVSRQVQRQRELLGRLRREDRDTTRAAFLLKTLVDTQNLFSSYGPGCGGTETCGNRTNPSST